MTHLNMNDPFFPRQEYTIYIRRCPTGWESFAKARGEGIILQAPDKQDLLETTAIALWAINEFGPEIYQSELQKIPADKLPKPLEFPRQYPIVEEPARLI